jgi:hypothetical protein
MLLRATSSLGYRTARRVMGRLRDQLPRVRFYGTHASVPFGCTRQSREHETDFETQ